MTDLATQIRRTILEQSRRANVGHIGSCLSIADILAALYGGVLGEAAADHADRDRFILSKGHGALALYAALHGIGRMSPEEIGAFCTDGTAVATHPEHTLAGVDFSTGSLWQGLTFGVGAALAARLQGSTRRVFVVVSDAECNEGALWEAVMFAAHHRLGNLVAIIDANGQQALGMTADVLDLEPLAPKWEAFGWDAREVDGHDVGALTQALSELETGLGSPHVLIARTTFGKGVRFMEGQLAWHYLPMSADQYAEALAEVDSGPT